MRGNPIGFRVQRLNHSATVTPAPPSAALRLEPPRPQRDSAGPPFPPSPPSPPPVALPGLWGRSAATRGGAGRRRAAVRNAPGRGRHNACAARCQQGSAVTPVPILPAEGAVTGTLSPVPPAGGAVTPVPVPPPGGAAARRGGERPGPLEDGGAEEGRRPQRQVLRGLGHRQPVRQRAPLARQELQEGTERPAPPGLAAPPRTERARG